MTMYYCPRECNSCDERAAKATGFECGACGSTMTTTSPYDEPIEEKAHVESLFDRLFIECVTVELPAWLLSLLIPAMAYLGFFIGCRH